MADTRTDAEKERARQEEASARAARSAAQDAIKNPPEPPPPGPATLDAVGNMATHPEGLSAAEQERRRNEEAREAEAKLTPAQRRAREHRAQETASPAVTRAATALARAAAATPVVDGEFPPLTPVAPGETERGWSPEVTARHPAVLAENMARIAEMDGHSTGARRSRIESIDPTDPIAVQDALREQGFHEVRMRDLQNRAALLGFEELAAAEQARAMASPYAAAAVREALGAAQDTARAAGHEVD